MYEKILVPLDGSELAEVALPYAEELAGRMGSEIILVYVGESNEDPYRHMYQAYLDKMIETTRQGAERNLAKLVAKAIDIKSAFLAGNPAEEIVDYADREKIGLIVMATHGRSGLRRWALGGVADKVVRATEQPVALIRSKGARADVREKGILTKALVPLDGSKESEAVLPYIEELASKLKAEVILLRVLTMDYVVTSDEQLKQIKHRRASTKDYLRKVAARLKQKGIAAKAEFRETMVHNEASEIIKLANEAYVDVIAMSIYGQSGISHWAFGSVTERVLYEGDTPLLLVRPGATTD